MLKLIKKQKEKNPEQKIHIDGWHAQAISIVFFGKYPMFWRVSLTKHKMSQRTENHTVWLFE